VEDVFALTAVSIRPPDVAVPTEFEMAQVLSTVLVADAGWLAASGAESESVPTDWCATPEYAQFAGGSVQGIVQLRCITTRSGQHWNVICGMTREWRHYQQRNSSGDSAIRVNGNIVEKGTEPYAVITHALQLVATT
jgi:hypothetical protein